ncbi:unnamed protein product, partial [Polarella glacialis]
MLDALAKSKAGKTGEAVEWFRKIEKAGLSPDVAAFSSMILCFAKAAQPEEAESWFREMQLSKAGLLPNTMCYNALIDAYGRAGRPDAAHTWLRKMQEAGVKSNVMTYTNLISAHARLAQVDEAVDCLDGMAQAKLRPNVLSYTSAIVACLRNKAGDAYPRVAELMRRMQRDGLKADKFLMDKMQRLLGSEKLDQLRAELGSLEVSGGNARKEASLEH